MQARFGPSGRSVGLALIIAFTSLAALVAGLGLAGRSAQVAAAPVAEHLVCPAGCTFSTIQAAVDAATPGDLIKVAGGVYTDLHVRPRLDPGPGATVTQVVYLTKSVTIRGGYNTDFVEPPDPAANPTILDAQGRGRGIYMNGSFTVTLEGLQIVRGNAGDMGGHTDNQPAGGGIYVRFTRPVVRNSAVLSSSAGYGGGIYFRSAGTGLLERTLVRSNSAITGGGGIYSSLSPIHLDGNHILKNSSGDRGGGVQLLISEVLFTNNVFADNRAAGRGSGVYVTTAAPQRFIHNTFARNLDGEGDALYLLSGTAEMTNTIVAGQTVGVQTTLGAIRMEGTLWGGGAWANGARSDGSGTFDFGTINIEGDPAFVNPAAGDYHLGAASPARDQGVATSVTLDMDGDDRTADAGPDLGADEVTAAPQVQYPLYLPLTESD